MANFTPSLIIKELSENKSVFSDLLAHISPEQYLWKPGPEKWCLLEVVCHLYDEEREDFRARLKHVLDTPDEKLPSIDPPGWVKSRKYIEQDFSEKLSSFLREREESVKWLDSLTSPRWDNAYIHPKFGPMSGKMFLCNWLAHDHLHFRQITRLKYQYLKQISGESLEYAGEW